MLGLYFRQMFRARFLNKKLSGLATAILVGFFAPGTIAFGQTTSAGLPADCSDYESVPLPQKQAQFLFQRHPGLRFVPFRIGGIDDW